MNFSVCFTNRGSRRQAGTKRGAKTWTLPFSTALVSEREPPAHSGWRDALPGLGLADRAVIVRALQMRCVFIRGHLEPAQEQVHPGNPKAAEPAHPAP